MRLPTRSHALLLALFPCALIGCGGVPNSSSRQELKLREASLEQRIEAAIHDFHGIVGIYVRHLVSGESLAIRGDELFPTASMIKVPILVTLFDRIDRAELALDQKLTWDRKRIYPGEDLLAKFRDGEKISLRKLVFLMESLSDNSASLWLQELAGTGTRINEWLAAHGFEKTRMNSRTKGRKADWERYGWGQTSPREMAELLVRIRFAKDHARESAETMYRALSRSYWDREALSQIPIGVHVASKQGAVSDSRSEVLLVSAPHGPYVFCVITKEQKDKSWTPNNEGFVLLRRLSKLLWEHFEGTRRD